MPAFIIPARYAPEIEAVVQRAIDAIYRDAALRDGAGPFENGFIEADRIDHSRTGVLVITIAEAQQSKTAAA